MTNINDQYPSYNSFETFHKKAIVQFRKNEFILNFSHKGLFQSALFHTDSLLDVQERAKQFQSIICPKNLYFSHGQYISDKGIPYIVAELKRKDNSNRALMSLISQKHIIDSGDNSIPSFMVLQTTFRKNDLFLTTYFRALEVNNFLRINIEEIRIICQQILNEFSQTKKVYVNIFAFRAYSNPNQSPLTKPDFDLLDKAELLKLMEKDPRKIVELLRQKCQNSTVVDETPLANLKDNIENVLTKNDIHPCFNNTLVKQKINNALITARQLKSLRERSSHSKQIQLMNDKYLIALKEIMGALEKCLIH